MNVKELTLFDYLHSTFVSKKDSDISEMDSYPFYMMQRWGSMHSSNMTLLLNEYVNPTYSSMEDSRMQFQLISSATPKLKSTNWKYIKKKEKKEKVKKEGLTEENKVLLCKMLEMSRKDLDLIIQHNPKDVEKMIHNTEVLKGKKIS